MKNSLLFLPVITISTLISCSPNQSSTSDIKSNTNTSQKSTSDSSKSTKKTSSKSTTESKNIVKSHTLKDSNPPIDINSIGEVVSESTWDSFRNASSSRFNDNYNYTYNVFSGGYLTKELFTKNGYYMESVAGNIYYERKTGSSFYAYINTSEGYLRQDTTLDLQNKYTSRIKNEIYLHMFDFENYEYDSFDGCYRYYATSFTAAVKFQGGYLTYLYYILGTNFFEIKFSFETTIVIPESYYYSN